MTARLLDIAILDDVDDIAATDRTQTMRNGNGSSGMQMGLSLRLVYVFVKAYRPLLALSSAICTDFSDCASSALVASDGML